MLADLDELVMKCRDERAKKYIDEAVRCYRSGAYRASVVATWIAICFDIVDKLRELAASGDAQAEKIAQALIKNQTDGDYQAAMKFEANIPDIALQFEFVSHTEKVDLDRLKVDRNRCAHPSQNSDSEVFEVPSELARLHIRNAVCHLLQHEPAQGKGVLDRLWLDIKSATFPITEEKVLARIQAGPLRRPREALVRNFVVTLLKEIFLENSESKVQSKSKFVLMAVRYMHGDVWEQTVRSHFGVLTERLTTSAEMMRLAHGLDDPIAVLWDFLTAVQKERIISFVRGVPSEFFDELDILNTNIFGSAKDFRYSHSTQDEIIAALFFIIPKIVQFRLISFVQRAANFSDANKIFQLIGGYASDFDEAAIIKLIEASAGNRQAYDASSFVTVMKKFSNLEAIGSEFINKHLSANGLELLEIS